MQTADAPVALTMRERQVLDGMLKGYRSREIAEALNLSLKAVEYHRAALRRKTGARTAAELVLRLLGPHSASGVAGAESVEEAQ